jgi:nucleotide-binding universal stress UspA family protein
MIYRHILIPTDGSERSLRAASAGLKLAKLLEARVTGLFVSEQTYINEVDDDSKPKAASALEVVAALATEYGIPCDCVNIMAQSPQDGIVLHAKQCGCDLIVMGSHGRSRVGKLFLGSAAASVLADCDIPVLLYR